MSDVFLKEKEIAVKIMQESFDNNPAVHYAIGKKEAVFYKARRKALASFMYTYCKNREGIFISPNGNGVICFYPSSAKFSFLHDIIAELKLALFGVGIIRLLPVMMRANAVARIRNKQGEHLHCWYLGVREGKRDFKTAVWLRDLLFSHAEKLSLPVCAETTMLQNKMVYERMGFITYEEIKTFGMTTYLMIFFPPALKRKAEIESF